MANHNYIPNLPLEVQELGEPIPGGYPDQLSEYSDQELINYIGAYIRNQVTVEHLVQPLNFQQHSLPALRLHFNLPIAANTVERPMIFLHHWSYHPSYDSKDMCQKAIQPNVNYYIWVEYSKRRVIKNSLRQQIGYKYHYRLYDCLVRDGAKPRVKRSATIYHMDEYRMLSQHYTNIMNIYHYEEVADPSKRTNWNIVKIYRI